MAPHELKEAVIQANTTLSAPQPKGLTGKQALDRRTTLERSLQDSIQALKELDTTESAEALIDLLEVLKHSRFLRLVKAALKSSTVKGLGKRLAEHASLVGVSVLALHRDPAVLDALVEIIETHAEKPSKRSCYAVCLAASYGHQPSIDQLEDLLVDPVTLEHSSWLLPMLSMIVSGDSEHTWEITSPLRKTAEEDPKSPLKYRLIGAVSRTKKPDLRWADLAMSSLGKSTHAAPENLLGKLAKASEAVRDRLLAMGTPSAHSCLVTAGDERVRPILIEQVKSGDLSAVIGGIGLLKRFGNAPTEIFEDNIVRSFVKNIEERMEIEEDTVHMLLEQIEAFSSLENADQFAAAIHEARLLSDAPYEEHRKIKKMFGTQIEKMKAEA